MTRKCQERQSPAFLLDPTEPLPPVATLPLHLSRSQVRRASFLRWVRWLGSQAELRLLPQRVRAARTLREESIYQRLRCHVNTPRAVLPDPASGEESPVLRSGQRNRPQGGDPTSPSTAA